MKKIETKIKINAPRQKVWDILMDFKRYKEWNPFIINIAWKDERKNKLNVTFQQQNGKQMNFSPELLIKDEGKEFRWKGKLLLKGIFDGEHFFKLESNKDGSTTLIHGEHFSGILVKPILKSIGESTKSSFEEMNRALKREVE